MLANRRRDTKPELSIRRLLYAHGFRYRVDYRPVVESRTRADIAFTRRKLAIFIDGCFWHGCPIHATHPKRNADYWLPKLKRNIERDLEASAILRENGWTVLRYWEHQDPAAVVDDIETLIRTQRVGFRDR